LSATIVTDTRRINPMMRETRPKSRGPIRELSDAEMRMVAAGTILSPEQFRGRYQLRLDEARDLLK
jgi:hypothetical protein